MEKKGFAGGVYASLDRSWELVKEDTILAWKYNKWFRQFIILLLAATVGLIIGRITGMFPADPINGQYGYLIGTEVMFSLTFGFATYGTHRTRERLKEAEEYHQLLLDFEKKINARDPAANSDASDL